MGVSQVACRMALSMIAIVTLTILLFEHCTTVTLTRFTQQRVGFPRAAPTVAVLVTELIKLLLSLVLELTPAMGMGTNSSWRKAHRSVVVYWRDTMRLSIPALLYTIQNNLIFVALGTLEVLH